VFEVSSAAESRVSALQAENSLLAEAVNRSNSRIAELEQQLLYNNSNSNSSNSNSSNNRGRGLDREGGSERESTPGEDKALASLLLAELRAECQRKDETARAERLKHESAMREGAAQLAKEREAAARLRQELSDRPSRDDHLTMARQLKALQRIVFNLQDGDNDVSSLHAQIYISCVLQYK
jgi:hypothetical protein